ncbi:hypothetical protein [Streptomyces sp. NPDC001568]|uniref:hypothetical protein n=1 Tax=Streptomyces sp. NPDC001568 TaxID=3364588 RepID=UPI0036862A25
MFGQRLRRYSSQSSSSFRVGGIGGLIVGSLTVYGYAFVQGWPASIPHHTIVTGPVVSVVVAALAGIHPALRAAKASPTDALRSA